MSTTLIRVVNQQRLIRSILIDKIDRSQGNFDGSGRRAKQKVYVPYANPLDSTVRGYIDMVPTDEVLLSMNGKGTLAKLASAGYISTTAFSSSLTATPVVSAAVHGTLGAIAGQIGVAATIATSVGAKAIVIGLLGMTASSVGHTLLMSNGAVGANNGPFVITDYLGPTSVKIANSAADGSGSETNNGTLHWTEETIVTTITGTTFLSMSPDVTRVTLTTPGGVSQTFTDATLLAAVLPTSFANTSIVIDNTLVVGGPVVATWKVQITANSKVSNLYTVT